MVVCLAAKKPATLFVRVLCLDSWRPDPDAELTDRGALKPVDESLKIFHLPDTQLHTLSCYIKQRRQHIFSHVTDFVYSKYNVYTPFQWCKMFFHIVFL